MTDLNHEDLRGVLTTEQNKELDELAKSTRIWTYVKWGAIASILGIVVLLQFI